MKPPRIPPPDVEERLPRFDTANILWYFGAIAAGLASNAVVADTDSSARGVWILLVSIAFAAAYGALAVLLRASRWWVPGGLFAAMVVSLVPAIGVGFERLIGVGPSASSPSLVTPTTAASTTPSSLASGNFDGSAFALALATVVAGLIVYALVQFEFVLALVTIACLVTAGLFLPAVDDRPSADDVAVTLLVTGAVLVLVGLLLDGRGRRRPAFWWHVVGLGGVAYGLVYFVGSRHDSAAWAAMLVSGAVVLALSVPLGRATWGAYGLLGAYAPLVHYIVDSGGHVKIPLILVFVSLAVLFSGVVARLYGSAVRAWAERTLRI